MSFRRPCRRAVFLDRDGVLVEDTDYVHRVRALRVLPGAAEAVRRLNKAGLKVVVVSNQSGVGRGFFSLRTLQRINRALKERLDRGGARLDALYYCPHPPAGKGGKGCACRKPRTALIERAAKRFGIELGGCYMVGDSTTDLVTARNAGCVGILVRTGKGGRDGRFKAKPHVVCRDLLEAVEWILRNLSKTSYARK
ncbi:MAG: HAD family hydrolase [Elusimicrobia bacterium]|nr:HAD family hydrolase [Elusimicrobiota bacterium]